MKMINLSRLFITVTVALGCAAAASAQVPEGYYDSLSGLNGSALRKAVKNAVKNHTAISYGKSTWSAFMTTDTRMVNGKLCFWDMYSDNNVPATSSHDGMNIEHAMANSWWGGSNNTAYKDLFNLNPSNIQANSMKNNYPIGEVADVEWTNGVSTVGAPVSGQGGGKSMVYEPADEYKGDFARGFMYMFSVYEDLSWGSNYCWMMSPGTEDFLKPWARELLLKWHRQDPVSQKEIDRNEAVYKVQHNRNPFIDSPELAEYIWGTHKDQKYEYGGEYVPVDPGPGPVDPEDPEPGPGEEVKGEWVQVRSMSEINADDLYVMIATESFAGMGYSLAGNSYMVPTEAVAVTDIQGTYVASKLPSDIAVLSFVKAGSGYNAKVTDLSGDVKGWLSCTSAKCVKYADSASGEGTVFTLGVSGGEATIDFGGDAGILYYNEKHPRFTTYSTSAQHPTMLLRHHEDKQSGVEAIPTPAEACGEPRVFTLQGVEVKGPADGLAPGIYIVATPGEGARKILIN